MGPSSKFYLFKGGQIMSKKYSNLKSKTLADLRDLAKGLKIVGRYQMDKEALIEAINASLAETSRKTKKAEKAPANDPISMAKATVKESRAKLKEARNNLLDQTTEAGIADAKNKVKAAENVLRMAKEQLKDTKKAAREGREFSWKSILGWAALVLVSAAGGAGTAMLLERNGTEVTPTNGDTI